MLRPLAWEEAEPLAEHGLQACGFDGGELSRTHLCGVLWAMCRPLTPGR